MNTQVELEDDTQRFEFGRNWYDFIQKNFGKDRVEASKKKILEFLGRDNLEGLDMIDIGCGSGLHSIAALEAGVKSVHGFDYDPESIISSANRP